MLLNERLLVWATAVSYASAAVTTHYINQVPLYSSLTSCAEAPLSAIVRGESSGCGEDFSSFTCFCTQSSSRFNSIISKAVSSNCGGSIAAEQASSAGAVFASYCQLGAEDAIATTTPTTATATGLAPAATAAANTAAPTSVIQAPTSLPSISKKHATAIAVGVAVPVAVVALLLAAFFLRRRHQKRVEASQEAVEGPGSISGRPSRSTSADSSNATTSELDGEKAMSVYEMSGESNMNELPSGEPRGELDAETKVSKLREAASRNESSE
ncbi:hypothetical protein FH972_026728 [Carpinus fangiana]|uniref:Extracellular membrane protein CFEM domain-containing protein n=1 Tax=Carpinus fangiana TaxID=176857 RepID=A0A5N6L7D1_9ROSI|nr:hypothetical protein FH972_026728 [Carpinus fangiana]